MSTSTQSNIQLPGQLPGQSPEQSPLGQYSRHGSNIAVEPLSLRSEELPNVSLVTRNILLRTAHEIKENVDTIIPRMGGIHNMKRAFHDFFIKESVGVFDFLNKSVDSNTTISKAAEIVKRFGRTDYNIKKSGIRDLCIDIDCHNVLDALQISLQIAGKSSDPLAQWIVQTRQILEQWRLATSQLMSAEKQLDSQCHLFDDILKKANAILELPSGVVEQESIAYKHMVYATEEYIKKVFAESSIEETFHEYCKALKKVALLTDAMGAVRVWMNTSKEPMCSICVGEPIAIVYVPCGHTFCKECGQRQTMTCHICRTVIREKQKIYFS